MAKYNITRESKLYLVQNNLRYLVDLYPGLSASQTFNETSVPVKTLHSQYNMFESAVITKANPANFSFTIPIYSNGDLDVILKLLRDYSSSGATLDTADLYIEASSGVYKLEKAVIDSGTFQLVMNAPLILSVSGTAAKLSEFTGTIPGTLQTRSARAFTRISTLAVLVGGVEQSHITAVTMELKNNVQWLEAGTLQNSLGISSASGTVYPGAFVVSNRTLSGTIQQYITDESKANVNSWSTTAPISIRVKSGTTSILTFNLPSVVYTNRMDVQEVFVQSYDFRMNTVPPSMANVIIKG